MRILMLSFYFLFNACYAQKASISNIILRPDSHLSTNYNDSITYPVVQVTNPTVSNKINQSIRQEILLDEDQKKGIKDALHQAARKWLITLEYEITYNNHGLLSLNTVDIDKFRITKDLLEVMDDCEFPHVILGLGPTYHLRYPIKYLSNFLRPYIKMKL